MANKTMEVVVERPVDGDTVRVLIDGKSESIRILGLDTEESKAGGDKPLTPWGKKAAEHAAELLSPGKTLTLDFDAPEDGELDVNFSRFRDNFGRLLALVVVDGMDFQEHMIGPRGRGDVQVARSRPNAMARPTANTGTVVLITTALVAVVRASPSKKRYWFITIPSRPQPHRRKTSAIGTCCHPRTLEIATRSVKKISAAAGTRIPSTPSADRSASAILPNTALAANKTCTSASTA